MLAENVGNDAVNRGEIEVSGNTKASHPDERNGRMPVRSTAVSLNSVPKLTLTSSYQFDTKDNNETSALISQFTSTVTPANGTAKTTTYKYFYDANGNITEIKDASDVIQYKYTYDSKGQLIREDNRPMNRTYLYTYDDAGNILTGVSYRLNLGSDDFTELKKLTDHVFHYDANGRISLYENKGSFEYDAVGNPKKYRSRSATWKNGRQLATFKVSGVTYEFDYNSDGLRTYKSGGGLTTEYVLNGSQVMRQIINDGTTTYIADYIYHENGTPMAFAFYEEGGTPTYYFYETNLQGDIINIYDENGSKIVGFRYDAWGDCNTDKYNATICTDMFLRASLFRYRGYIYDYETSFYYLQSRYYDPEVGRFINADSALYHNILGYNMYAYCHNNPVNNVDDMGEDPDAILKGWATTMWWLTGVDGPLPIGDILYVGGVVALGIVAVTVAVVASDVIYEAKDNKKSNDKDNASNKGKDPDPYRRPGQKKQGRERKNKARQKKEWVQKTNPRQPKKHTPGRDHRKYGK